MIFGLYAFLDRFGNWSQPFLAHDNEEACAMIKEGLKGKQLSYVEQSKSLYQIARYGIQEVAPLLPINDGVVLFVCRVDDLLLEEKGSAENV